MGKQFKPSLLINKNRPRAQSRGSDRRHGCGHEHFQVHRRLQDEADEREQNPNYDVV